MAEHVGGVNDARRDYLGIVRPVEEAVGGMAVKAIETFSNPVIVGYVLVAFATWFASGALAYQVAWERAAKIHSPIPSAVSGLSPEFRDAMLDVHSRMIKEHANGFANTTR